MSPSADNANLDGAIVLAAPRSGTTLLRRLLNGHPQIHCPSETNVFSGCGRFLNEEQIASGTAVGVLNGLAFAGIQPDETLRRLREFAFGLHRDLCRAEGKSTWVSKTAFDGFYVGQIERLCGDHCRYVCMIRHGLDVAGSIQELCEKNGVYLNEIHAYVRQYPLPLEAFTRLWMDITARVRRLAAERPQQTLTIRYEDLVADPQAEMQRVFAFLGHDASGWDISQALSNQDAAGFGDWKTYRMNDIVASQQQRWKRISPTILSRLAAIANPLLAECGYDPLPVKEPPDAESARRRHQIGLLLPEPPSASP